MTERQRLKQKANAFMEYIRVKKKAEAEGRTLVEGKSSAIARAQMEHKPYGHWNEKVNRAEPERDEVGF